MDSGQTRPSTFPTARAYRWLAAGVMVFAVYASVIPFELRFVPVDSALDDFLALLMSPPERRLSRANYLANLLLFIPIGFGGLGALLVDRRRSAALVPAAMVIVLTASIAVSLTAEFLQMFAPGRVPSRADVIAQSLGCLIGMAGWLLAGPALTTWLRETAAPGRADRFARVLAAYAAAWLFVNLAPFDITLSPGEISRRLRTGRITLLPFGSGDVQLARAAWDAFVTCLSAVPLGVLGLVGWARGARRAAGDAFLVGAVLVVAVEGAHIFIRSHAADSADVIFGLLGVALGVWAGIRTFAPGAVVDPAAARLLSGWAAAAFAAWCLILLAYHWMPYDFSLDSRMIRRKLADMSFIPFFHSRAGSDLNSFNDLLVKLGLSIPLGVAGGLMFRRSRTAPTILPTAAALVAAAIIFAAIEAGQVFLPQRVPSPTDVLVGVAGAAVGLWLGRWLSLDSPRGAPGGARPSGT